MIAKERDFEKYTKVIITQDGGTATDTYADINTKAKSMFAGIGCILSDLERGASPIGRPLFRWYTWYTVVGNAPIPVDLLHKVNKFQVTSGNTFKCTFTDELLRDHDLCTYCLLKPDCCTHNTEAQDKKRGFGGGSRAENKRMAIAKYAGSSSTS